MHAVKSRGEEGEKQSAKPPSQGIRRTAPHSPLSFFLVVCVSARPANRCCSPVIRCRLCVGWVVCWVVCWVVWVVDLVGQSTTAREATKEKRRRGKERKDERAARRNAAHIHTPATNRWTARALSAVMFGGRCLSMHPHGGETTTTHRERARCGITQRHAGGATHPPLFVS